MKDYFDDFKKLLGENKAYENLVESQGMCLACGHDNPMDFESHHIAGKSNSPLGIILCRNCHGRLSRNQQQDWPRGWSKKSKPSMKALAMLLRGISDVLRLTSDYLWEMSFDE